jgi:Holliday junction resolvase RusA-like endonuclease
MIEIVVLGTPVAKGRPRFAKDTGHAYTPEKTRNFEAALKYAAQEVMGPRAPLDGPLVVEMKIVMPIAKSWPKKRQKAARDGAERPIKKPDWDNFAKVVDALNQVVWVDDGQVVDGRVLKFYGDKPGTWITVRSLNPETEGVFG